MESEQLVDTFLEEPHNSYCTTTFCPLKLSVTGKHAAQKIPNLYSKLSIFEKHYTIPPKSDPCWTEPSDYSKLDSAINAIPAKYLLKVFSHEELAIIGASSIFSRSASWDELISPLPLVKLTSKLRLSAWHSCSHSLAWENIKQIYNVLSTLTIPHFDISIDFTGSYNNIGTATNHPNIFLDAEMGLMLYHKNVHVLTIGFDVCVFKTTKEPYLLIKQIQSPNKKGNKPLFKLCVNSQPWFSSIIYTLSSLITPHFPLYIKDGAVLADSIINNYQKSIDRILDRTTGIKSSRSDYDKKNLDYLTTSVTNIKEHVKPRMTNNYNQLSCLYKRHYIPPLKAYSITPYF